MITRFPSGVWAIVLIASVLVNGLILGAVVAGAAMDVRVRPARSEIPGPPPLRDFEDRLPDGMREGFGVQLRERALEARPLVEEMQAANAEAMRAMTAEPFDEAAARAAFERTRVARAALEAHAHDITISLFANLPQETRENLVRRSGSRVVIRGFSDGDRMNGDRRDGPDRNWRFDGPRRAQAPGDQEPCDPAPGD